MRKEKKFKKLWKFLIGLGLIVLASILILLWPKEKVPQKPTEREIPKEEAEKEEAEKEIAKEPPKPIQKCIDCKEMFYLNFDGNFKNEKNQQAGKNFGGEFRKGNWGQGAYFGEKSYLRFPSASNINYEKGTIEFWFKPESFFPTDREIIYANGFDGWSEDDVIRMGILDKTFWVEINGPAGGSPQIFQDIAGWQTNVFHYIVMTWNNDEVRLYLDGNLASQAKLNRHPTRFREYIYIGNMNINGKGFNRPSKGAIDELKIYDGVRNGDEIKETFSQTQL